MVDRSQPSRRGHQKPLRMSMAPYVASFANACLQYLRKLEMNDPYLIEEVNLIDIQLEHDRTAVGVGFFAPIKMVREPSLAGGDGADQDTQVFTRWSLLRRLIIVTTLFMWQNGTGISASFFGGALVACVQTHYLHSVPPFRRSQLLLCTLSSIV